MLTTYLSIPVWPLILMFIPYVVWLGTEACTRTHLRIWRKPMDRERSETRH